ncbi:MAG TPA: S8 family serine peptidase [Terriglobales bacterium]|nr:S8 family serine peptidase [Terriglobales bacterium]
MKLRIVVVLMFLAVASMASAQMIGINVVLNRPVSNEIVAELKAFGAVRDVVPEIRAITVQAKASNLPVIQSLPYVAAANPDQERDAIPTAAAAPTDFSSGLSTWNLDAVNVTEPGYGLRTVPFDGSGVYVAVLDSGLLRTWPYYFPAERIATKYARSFGGGGGWNGYVSSQPNKWEEDQNSHGIHVTSTILGYNFSGVPINGVAPKATVIPVKVLNQTGRGWSSVIARGIVYVADLKVGPLAGSPVVINMSLSGPVLDSMEAAAVDYAISKGVIIVAAAGNRGTRGMGYPAAYAPVISVAASGWTGEWKTASWWWKDNVPDSTNPDDYYIGTFSSRQLKGQDLDVAAPGTWVLGPYQDNGQISWYFLGGTSMASPHVAGIVAMMAQKKPSLTTAEAESILESTAIKLPAGCRNVIDPNVGAYVQYCWGADATGAGLATADAALNALP